VSIQGVSGSSIPLPASAPSDASPDGAAEHQRRAATQGPAHWMPHHAPARAHSQVPHWILTQQKALPQILLGMRAGKLVPPSGTLVNKNQLSNQDHTVSGKNAARIGRTNEDSIGASAASDSGSGLLTNEVLIDGASAKGGGLGSDTGSQGESGYEFVGEGSHGATALGPGESGTEIHSEDVLQPLQEQDLAQLKQDAVYWTSSLRLAMQCATAHPGADIFVQAFTVVDEEGNAMPSLGTGARLRKNASGGVSAFALTRPGTSDAAEPQPDASLMQALAQAPAMLLSLRPIVDERGAAVDLIRRAAQAEYAHLVAHFNRPIDSDQMSQILKACSDLLAMWQHICSDPQILELLGRHGDALQRQLVERRTEPSESISSYSNQQYLARVNWINANAQVTSWVNNGQAPTIERIKSLNRLLGQGLAPWNNVKRAAEVGAQFGEYRTVDTVCGIPPRYYLRCDHVGAAMTDLLEWYETAVQRKTLPLIIAAQIYQRFVSIHPFADANGRTGRLLMDWILQLNGMPPALMNNNNLALFPNESTNPEAGTAELQVIEGLRKSLDLHVEMLRVDEQSN
jgi:hypothetical protein